MVQIQGPLRIQSARVREENGWVIRGDIKDALAQIGEQRGRDHNEIQFDLVDQRGNHVLLNLYRQNRDTWIVDQSTQLGSDLVINIPAAQREDPDKAEQQAEEYSLDPTASTR